MIKMLKELLCSSCVFFNVAVTQNNQTNQSFVLTLRKIKGQLFELGDDFGLLNIFLRNKRLLLCTYIAVILALTLAKRCKYMFWFLASCDNNVSASFAFVLFFYNERNSRLCSCRCLILFLFCLLVFFNVVRVRD